MTDYTNLIFENYEQFLKEHHNEFSTPSDAIEMLTSDGAFRAYISSLTEGLDPEFKRSFLALAEREREVLLQESLNVGPSPTAIGYAVTHFPILVDIYTDPILSKVATIYPVDKPTITIPKIRVESRVKNVDGTITTWRLPRTYEMVRGTTQTIQMLPGTVNRVFAMAGNPLVTPETMSLNQRYFVVKNLRIRNSNNVEITLPVLGRPDTRGQIKLETRFNDPSNVRVLVTLVGNVNFSTGLFQYNVTFTNENNPNQQVPNNIQIISADVDVMFNARRGDIGRVNVSIISEGWDINIDVRDNFEIVLDQERIDDFADIYNIDLLRTISSAIKSQMLYNKDIELAYYLEAFEPVFISNGAYSEYDVSRYLSSQTGQFRPANVLDVFKGVIPHIITVNRRIKRNFRADPQFLVAGEKTAVLLESLQDLLVTFNTSETGIASGEVQSLSSFRKQTILASPAIKDDRIYVIYKAPGDNLSTTAIADLVYKPLYVVEGVDESQFKTYIKSRTALEITAPEAIGFIKMTNYSGIL